jgi:hypothetical protein
MLRAPNRLLGIGWRFFADGGWKKSLYAPGDYADSSGSESGHISRALHHERQLAKAESEHSDQAASPNLDPYLG